ncbi:MAG: gliding motility-associated C-terminal domain-containing protein, partial [Bacteroidetes bacterium]|nr:gliding motility-associated C-terminal domain-containing protein [Bacteroidota bacterium]
LNLYPGHFIAYTWQDGSNDTNFVVSQAGLYSVSVQDQWGCVGSGSVQVSMYCPDIYFPTAFTPNNDLLNDGFGPWGGLSMLSNYRLSIFGRWGELVFTSTDPYKKWDGKYKGSRLPMGVYTWISSFRLRGADNFRKGTITILK